MTLQEAIEVNTALARELDLPQRVNERIAIKIGIEAMKEVERLRRVETFDPTIALPGETKE